MGHSLVAQDVLDTIYINNPSFDTGMMGISVPGWTDCHFQGETPFDIQPGLFGCQTLPSNGVSYIGLVVRDNETYEAVSQRLIAPLERGKCYGFSLDLARSMGYKSLTHSTGQMAPYTTPARIRLWGAEMACQRREMLAETGPILNTMWKSYFFKLEPIRNYRYLIIEVFYKTPTLFPYNGNVLVDNGSNIYEIKCDVDVEETLLAMKEEKPKVEPIFPQPPKKTKVKEKKDPIVVPPKRTVQTKKDNMPALNEKVVKGQVLRIKNLNFKANSAEIPRSCNHVLMELYDFLVENPKVIIELGGHTNNRCETKYCKSLSEKRAKAVADWLITKGIASDRLSYKGYGKKNPIATNSTTTGMLKNQRVEVKIIGVK